MRCVACDKNLNDFESTRKHAVTGEFVDLCNRCFKDVASDIPVVTREDLEATEQIDMEDFVIDEEGDNDE
jgi:hypothetical protein